MRRRVFRYADRAKQIVCEAVINEDPNQKMIRVLKEEVTKLRDKLMANGINVDDMTTSTMEQPKQLFSAQDNDAMDKLKAYERMMEAMDRPWEERLRQTEDVRKKLDEQMREMGLATTEDGSTLGVFSPKKLPHLVNLNEDPLMSECLLYYLKEGRTRVGRPEAERRPDVILSGEGILDFHCIFSHEDGSVSLEPQPNAACYVNGRPIAEPTVLHTGSRIILGKHHVFR